MQCNAMYGNMLYGYMRLGKEQEQYYGINNEKIVIYFLYRQDFGKGGRFMGLFWTIVEILIIIWLFGFAFGLIGRLIHILLVAAIIAILIRIILGRNPF
jgi:hypothetical protein